MVSRADAVAFERQCFRSVRVNLASLHANLKCSNATVVQKFLLDLVQCRWDYSPRTVRFVQNASNCSAVALHLQSTDRAHKVCVLRNSSWLRHLRKGGHASWTFFWCPPPLVCFFMIWVATTNINTHHYHFSQFCVISIPLQAHPRTHQRGQPESSILQSWHQQSAGDHRQLSGSAQGHFSIPHETKLKAAYIRLVPTDEGLATAVWWLCSDAGLRCGAPMPQCL